MEKKWYIDANGSEEGPFTESELRARAVNGLLLPTDRVSTDRAAWVTADSIANIAFLQVSSSILEMPKPRKPFVETVVTGATDPNASLSAPAPAFSPLDSVPGYDVQGTLGTGACGVVFRALQKKLNRVVALKTVLMAQNTPGDIIVRFEQEAVMLARLQHPNIVSVYDCGHSHGRAFFAMELLEGEDLAKRLERTGPLDERTAWLIARQTAAALDHAAKLNVIHRDIKPANLFLVPPPTGFPLPPGVPMVKVTDFGLALAQRGPNDSNPRHTAAGVMVGTPIYMAPEQFTGTNANPRADIYSLGTTVYHILTGQMPFDGKSLWDVMLKKSAPLPRLAAPISHESADLVEAMMATDPANRPADYAALIARIDALPCLQGSSGPAPVVRDSGKRKRWRLLVAVAAMVVIGVAVGVAYKSLTKPPTYATGAQELLFDRNTVLGWNGSGWAVELDDEKSSVLMGSGSVSRPLRPMPDFRAILSLDPYSAEAVEIVVATTEGQPQTATRWIVHLDRTEAAFGKREGTEGKFEAVGPVLRVPSPKELADMSRPPYLEVQYQRAGGTVAAWFRGQPLGETSARGLQMTELRVQTNGGSIRIASAEQVELIANRK